LYDKKLKIIVNQDEHKNNYPLVKIIYAINEQLLIKITKLILNNQLELYRSIENIISDIKESNMIK